MRYSSPLSFLLSLFPPSFSSSKSHLWLPAERGVEKVNLLLALYAMLGLSQSAPALALTRVDSLPDSSAQGLSVKWPVMGIVVNTETPQSTGLTGARSHTTNYKKTLIHFSHNKLVIILSVIETSLMWCVNRTEWASGGQIQISHYMWVHLWKRLSNDL